jgi:hypothetical protein
MLEELKGLPVGVIGFEAVGTVEAEDYRDVLEPAIDSAARLGGIRLVYVMGERFEGYSSKAMWEDSKVGLGHVRSWERTALVSDSDWARHLVQGLGWMFPGKVRQYQLKELDDAIAWAGSPNAD